MLTAQVMVCDVSAVQLGGVHDQLCPPSSTQFFKVASHEALLIDSGLASVFEAPSSVDIGAAFFLSFSTTIILWMVAKGFGSIIGFIRSVVR